MARAAYALFLVLIVASSPYAGPPGDREKGEGELARSKGFSRFVDETTTHNVNSLEKQIRILNLLSRWKLSGSQTKMLYDLLLKVEPERKGFSEQVALANQEAEKYWLQLRDSALNGVIHSFEQPKLLQRPAGLTEMRILSLRSGYYYKMGTHIPDILRVLTREQENVMYKTYCGSCHSSKRATPQGDMPDVHGDRRGVEFLEKLRKLTDAQYANSCRELISQVPRIELPWRIKVAIKRHTGVDVDKPSHSAADEERQLLDFFREVRQMSKDQFNSEKTALAGIVQAPNYEVRAFAMGRHTRKQMRDMTFSENMNRMLVDCFFDGTLLQVLPEKLRVAAEPEIQPVPLIDPTALEQGGESAFQRNCTVCHSEERAMVVTKPTLWWHATVRRMLYAGGNVNPELVRSIAMYLNDSAEQRPAKRRK